MSYCHSSDEERFTGDETLSDRDDAIHAALDDVESVGDVRWTGRSVPPDIGEMARGAAERTLSFVGEYLSESSGEEYGEVSEEWPSETPESDAATLDAVAAAIESWIKTKCPPNFWRVADIQRHEVTRMENDERGTRIYYTTGDDPTECVAEWVKS